MSELLFTYYLKGILRYFTRDTLAKSITAFFFVLVLGILAVIIHIGFYFGFTYVARDIFFGEAVSLYVIELFLLVSFVLTFASAIVSGLVTLFQVDDGPVLLASPRYDLKPWFVFLRMFFSSLWPLLIVIIPALIAIVRIFSLSMSGFLLALIAAIVLIFIATLSAMLVLFFSASILFVQNVFSRRHLLVVSMAIFFLFLGAVWTRFHSVNLTDFFQARLLSRTVPDLTPILEQFYIFPSHQVAMVIHYAEQGNLILSISSLLFLIVIALVLFFLFLFLKKHYLQYWQVAQEDAGKKISHVKNRRSDSIISQATTPESALLLKEAVLFVRNPRGMLWLGFIFVIWGIQSASTFLLVRGLGVERVTESAVPGVTVAFQFALVSYFISMFALRFAFPSFSEERKTAWVAGSAPLAFAEVFTSKLYFFVILFCTIAFAFTALNVSIIGFNATVTPLLFLMIGISVITITVYALALGALFPNDETDDPEVLSTTLPGLSFIAVTLLYGGAGALVFYVLTIFGNINFVLFFIVLSFLVIMILPYTVKMVLKRRSSP